MLKNTKIGYSSLSDKVYMWKSKSVKWGKPGLSQWIWEKIDISNMFMSVLEQFLEVWTTRVIKQWEKETLYIVVKNTQENRKKFWIKE